MTPRHTTLRSSTVGTLLMEPLRAAIDSPMAAKVLAVLLAALGIIWDDVFLVAFIFAFIASTLDYFIGRWLAEQRSVVDDVVAANGLLVKLAALALLLFVYGMDIWVFSRMPEGVASMAGTISAGCCAVWIHKELKSVDRLTEGRIPFIRPFLAVLDAVIGRLLPDPPPPEAEPGISEFVRRRLDAAGRGEEPPARREYDGPALQLEQELETTDGEPFHDAARQRDIAHDPERKR